ncbi:Serine/threonine-protein kinase Nek7, putative [Perkinsus marinus ATCC 50983]|uniref:Serine/threonine-protein kinase Nek7, putative n=1 Tax=Perkinsus marinus (strain ATCC 50983 / TXsc) TaxID=423536 RepID=C5LD33_PERM5|nr:Serine/threonine-protein kinase Nek7, putative [Perkinsus marinus ATCC 50983]EER05377.1 Serine/threonine-protein kinase Nek7, putative [Perkinsus marinus ATCC 50983]|eukprot:XP_002773561.1 Serine/threonine-protein kinase Nek7, putative [Perkinsus marinus ATCC 50983]
MTGTTSPSQCAQEPPTEWPTTTDGYQLECPIGYGAFATVYKASVATGDHAGEDVAIKVIDLECLDGTTFDDIRKELQVMRMCTHPNVIAYHAAFSSPDAKMWLVMPLINGGSCQNVIREYKKSTGHSINNIGIIAYILHETAIALRHFHSNQQIHRDLKAGNILLSLDGKVYDYKADIWSFGVTALELANGSAPYQNLHPLKVMKNILENPPPTLERTKSTPWDSSFVKMVADCLQKDPSKRPSIDQLLTRHDAFFRQADKEALVNLLKQLPTIELREPTKPPGYRSPRASKIHTGYSGAVSGAWDFDLHDADDGDDDDNKDGDSGIFSDLGEEET